MILQNCYNFERLSNSIYMNTWFEIVNRFLVILAKILQYADKSKSFFVYLIYFFSFSHGSVIAKIMRSVAKLKSCYSAAIWIFSCNSFLFCIINHSKYLCSKIKSWK